MGSGAKISVDNVAVAWYLCSFINMRYEAEITGDFYVTDPYLHSD
jgi:hypothetical protein